MPTDDLKFIGQMDFRTLFAESQLLLQCASAETRRAGLEQQPQIIGDMNLIKRLNRGTRK
jgi:hypothetical protein